MTRIGCYHAHYSNIEHIENALTGFEVELVHFVDPGLDRIKMDTDFNNETVENKVRETLCWISGSHVDAILITCTFFTSAYRESLHPLPIPVIKIDDPLFQNACRSDEPVLFVFTNPNTIKGTMEQFQHFCQAAGRKVLAEASVLEHTFSLIMQGKKDEYTTLVSSGLKRAAQENPGVRIVAAQLSMAPAARQAEQETGATIGNHLNALTSYMIDKLSLQKKK
ncbi:hypothetical protein A8L34_26755 [Bacillus sp. FJAT-27264]|uniref:hypothetical protein n=1 Tax=Paenibacillus sp. (strain DSM 101736 / FJAT-27264) TaxID=1850362 RepID=UPI000807D928|nr:hypothetical protein [Bacillus sp. FJAT-27264]OBZ16285.1 hypothetical protein A8L34_26755 [Bacillus sp. FJAT-27264]